ncbi:hypothetical protein [Leptolinea tardivitalis]|uniref:Uncharacterized protein n=1 Tax=Leptolinea tardivitalis TaxID=229920 RepID=A0A0P6Y0R9_9CHLR|nr:hypothetical protein [Leptolinea tardivitalis]KPL75093.1 hypothetical protein ADM99_00250 [Leptolinea tardivitalis]GAP20438.1 hypothetical protein LTAR_00627 [Leptolinea tardivitalis]
MTETILSGRLDGKGRNQLKGLLNMMYSPSELAEELGIDKNQVYRVYIKLNCPHVRDDFRHIWINGQEFKAWYLETYKKTELAEDETFCKTCRVPVKLYKPELKTKGRVTYLLSHCPTCGRLLTKIISSSRGNNY